MFLGIVAHRHSSEDGCSVETGGCRQCHLSKYSTKLFQCLKRYTALLKNRNITKQWEWPLTISPLRVIRFFFNENCDSEDRASPIKPPKMEGEGAWKGSEMLMPRKTIFNAHKNPGPQLDTHHCSAWNGETDFRGHNGHFTVALQAAYYTGNVCGGFGRLRGSLCNPLWMDRKVGTKYCDVLEKV